MTQLHKYKILIFSWFPLFLWMGVIFHFSSRQRIALADTFALNFLIFKTFHLIEYAFLFFLAHRALKYGSGVEARNVGKGSFLIVLLYALSDELHQQFVPTREGALRDVIIDCLGAGVLWIILTHIERTLPKKLKKLLEKWQVI